MQADSYSSHALGHCELRSRGFMYKNNDDADNGENEKPQDDNQSQKAVHQDETSTASTSSSVLILLLIMVALTWAIVATAYFGVIDYRSLVERSSSLSASDISSFLNSLNPVQYSSFRHPLRTLGGVLLQLDNALCDVFRPKDSLFYVDERKTVVVTLPIRKKTYSLKSHEVETKSFSRDVHKETKHKTGGDDAAKTTESDAVHQNNKMQGNPAEKSKRNGNNQEANQQTSGNVQKNPSEESTKKKPSGTKPKGNKADQPKKAKPDPFTSKKDQPILDKLKEGNTLLKQKKATQAEALFRRLVDKHPGSPRARFGLAESINMLAEEKRSNQMLKDAITQFDVVSQMPDCPPTLKKKALLMKADRESFLGYLKGAMLTRAKLVKEFPTDVEALNQLGVSYLMVGNNQKARQVYEQALQVKPNDGFALTHLGFIVKTEGDWTRGADLLRRGIDSREKGTQEGKFYFHLGDALHRTNRTAEAEAVYERGAKAGLFRSKYQRSLYNVDRLQSRPFWTAQQAKVTSYVQKLEKNWKLIRDEALRIMDVEKGLFLAEEESLKNTGEWRQFTLYQRGKKTPECDRVPKVCALFDSMPNAKGCTRGQIKYSIMMPGTHVWPHTGPTNCRLRMHLGLVVPTTGEGARLRCADEYRTWQEGKVMIFDDSFEHEVWQQAESFRLILIIDTWHPDLTDREKRSLSPI